MAPEFILAPAAMTEAFLRVASLSVAAYDYLITLPTEWRLYWPKRPDRFILNPGNVLFILIRYISIVTLVSSNVGFFHQGFTTAVCNRYYIIAPIFKMLQSMVSQAILGMRTYNISRRSKRVGYFLVIFASIVTGLQWFTDLSDRRPISRKGNCISGDRTGHFRSWSFYLIGIVYDLVTLGMSTFFLMTSAPDITRMTDLIRMMLYDGLGYFIIITGVNVVNLILYRSKDNSLQSSAVSMGYMVVWIMSQRLLMNVRAAAQERRAMVISHELTTARDVVDAMRSQFAKDDQTHCAELDVQVQVERAVTIEYERSSPFERESYRRPKLIWDSLPRP